MNAQPILDKIEEDAKAAAARTLEEAQKKADMLKAASRRKIEEMHQTMLAQAGKDSEVLTQRMLRMAELDARKELLGRKRSLIDEAFTLAGEKLKSAAPAEKRAFFLREIVRCASGNETLTIGGENAQWYDDRFLSDVNAALEKAGKPGQMTLAKERRADYGGVVLEANDAEIRCTFDAFLEEARAGMEQEIAAELFGKP